MGTRVRWLAGLAAAVLPLLPADLRAQDRQITGTAVRAESGQPLAGAEVTVLSAGRWSPALTAADGRFTLTVPEGEVRLMVRALGYSPSEVVVAVNQKTVDIALAVDVFRLSEVVVTGQATTIDRRSATTSIAYASGEDLQRVSSPTVLNALTGKITGVNLQSNSGAPGGGIQMQIRGKLLLLRSEIRWNTGNRQGAVDDLNLVRVHAGGLENSTLTASSSTDAFVTELLYNRLYSLLWSQGTRWLDARRYGRLQQLPVDRPGDSRFENMIVPAAECDARMLPAPCTPLTSS
ncbi:MAG: carboxypeptidase regulatory-like domain-containing protein [Gemmatimonadetes bacterium]|nr:carboxypeptidase regulatory-like domain-containing protein [Gemmatimonadota bacterium]